MAEGISAKLSWALSKAIKGARPDGQGSRSLAAATVTRKDPDGTVWVRMAGSDIDTPVNGLTTSSVSAGDVVQCQIDGTALSVTGNATDPAAGVSKTSQIATNIVRPVRVMAGTAQGIAKAAEKVAKAINQHFWLADDGIHVTQVTQEDWSDSTGESYQSGPNVLINSVGQLFRDGLNNLLTMTTESGARALTIWDGLGNEAANVLAYFGEVMRIGRESDANICVTSDSIQFNDGTDGIAEIKSSTTTAGANVATFETMHKKSGVSGARLQLVGDDTTNDQQAELCALSSARIGVEVTDSLDTRGDVTATSFANVSAAAVTLTDTTSSSDVTVYMSDLLGVAQARSGQVGQTNTVPAGGYVDVPVTFGHTYGAAPAVVVGLYSTSTAAAIGSISVAVTSVTTTGFTARLFNAGTTDRSPGFYWIAMGK